MNRVAIFLAGGLALSPAGHAVDAVTVRAESIAWTEVSASNGVKRVVLTGDPKAEGLFSLRARFPAGYRGQPHTHPMDLHVVVLSGKSSLGFGNDFDANALQDFRPGDYVLIPAGTPHYETFDEDSVLHLYGPGPMISRLVETAKKP